MLRSVGTNISIITNFGCRFNCWYCIWKKHDLRSVKRPIDWNKLKDFLQSNNDKGKVSISGGGDCLYNFQSNSEWWDNLFNITDDVGLLVDIHTREKLYNKLFWRKINRCSFSSDILSDDADYLKYLLGLVCVRIVHVATADTDFNMVDDYLSFCEDNNCQLTIKQLVGFSDGGMYDKVKSNYKNVFCLDEGDYNVYYMPDNTIRRKFLRRGTGK